MLRFKSHHGSPGTRPVRTKGGTAAARRSQGEPNRSESTEDHLERIQELVERKGYARVTDIAVSLGLSRSAVSNMVRRLARRGYVNYERYRGFTLTEEGWAVAAHIKIRHETLTELLQMMGLAGRIVDQEVESVEHHLRPETLQAFARLVRFWKNHPRQHRAFLASARAQPKGSRNLRRSPFSPGRPSA